MTDPLTPQLDDASRQIINQAVADATAGLSADLESLRSQLRAAEEGRRLAQQQLAELRGGTPNPGPTPPPPPPPAPETSLPPPRPLLTEPEIFTGDRERFESFLSQARQYIAMNQRLLPDGPTRCNYIASRIKGDAYRWIQALVDSQYEGSVVAPEMTDPAALVKYLCDAFGDPHKLQTAERRMLELRQTTTVAAFASEFRALVAVLGWNESQACALFKKGLKSEVRMLFPGRIVPTTLNELVKLCVELDDQLADRRREQARGSTARVPPTKPSYGDRAPAVSAPSKPPATSSGYAPMEVDRVEQERRFRAGECFKCGKRGHLARTCAEAYRPRVAAVTEATPAAGPATPTPDTSTPNPTPKPTPADVLAEVQRQMAALTEQVAKLQQGFF